MVRAIRTSGFFLNSSYSSRLKKLTSVSFSVQAEYVRDDEARHKRHHAPKPRNASICESSSRIHSSWSRLIMRFDVCGAGIALSTRHAVSPRLCDAHLCAMSLRVQFHGVCRGKSAWWRRTAGVDKTIPRTTLRYGFQPDCEAMAE